ncbi:hypothetical protein LG293_16835 (plasmid) [Citricoccus nitrophenolicus]
MAIKMIFIDVPNSVQRGLNSGVLRRFGSVVRRSSGPIFDHLDPLSGTQVTRRVSALTSRAFVRTMIQPGAAKAGVEAVRLGVSVRDSRLQSVRWLDSAFRAARGDYLRAAAGGTLTVTDIDRLTAAVDRFEARAGRRTARRLTPGSRPESMVLITAEHTRQLAESRSVDPSELPELNPAKLEGTVSELREHLKAQRRILSTSA